MDRYHHEDSCGHGRGRGFDPAALRGFRGPFGGHGHGGHGGFGGHGGGRARRGDVRTAVLRLLAEQPMHGYQIIQELSTRSGGAWSPSAGSVYPTLQLLADEGLVSAEETGGKKVFSLTEAGTTAVAETADQPAPWDEAAEGDSDAFAFRKAAMSLFPAVGQFAKNATPEQLKAGTEILTDARKKLYSMLAED